MKTRPKLLQICLTVLLLASPVTLLAQYTFTTNSDGSLTITQYTGPGGDVIIPSTINGNPVTGVGPYAFRLPGDPLAGYGANRIAVPTSVTNFASSAFAQVYTYSGYLYEIHFQDNAPVCTNIFDSFSASFPIVYYLSGTTGWGTNFNNRFSQVWYPGELIMTLSPTNAIIDGAEWQVDGGVWQTNGGMIDHLAYGNHTISFKSIHGWRAPADQIVFVDTNFITTATAANSYSALPGGPSQPAFQVLHTFTTSDGAKPLSPLLRSGNRLYGAASTGGSSNAGVIFAINTDGSAFTNIYSFTGGAGGGGPNGPVALSSNILYGATYGSVFRLNLDGTGFTNLCNVDDDVSGVILSSNILYGTTVYGGGGEGSVFSVNTDGTGFTTLHGFAPGDGGGQYTLYAGLAIYSNTLYGATFEGIHAGTLFSMNTDGTGFTNWSTPHDYYGGTMILKGTTMYGVDGRTLFSVNIDQTGFASLCNLPSPSGPPTPPLVLAGSTFYSTTEFGGYTNVSSIGYGTICAVHTDGTGLTNFYSFPNGSSSGASGLYTNIPGMMPQSSLLLIGTTLYGTAWNGGTNGNGTVFMLSFPPPQLNVTPSGTNVILTWPDGVHGAGYDLFSVQTATNLASPMSWTTFATPPVSVNGWNTVTNPLPIVPTFYRLTQ